MSKEIDKWITDHAYAPDDIVLGDGVTSISDRWLTSLHELLDIARPGWRELFDRPIHKQCAERLRPSTPGDAGVEGDDELFPWCCDHCNVLVALDEDPVVGPVHEQWRLDRLKKWGPNSPFYESKVLDLVTSEREDDLRELLSYCKGQTDIYGKQFDDDRAASYDDVATKLAAILDGER